MKLSYNQSAFVLCKTLYDLTLPHQLMEVWHNLSKHNNLSA